MSIMERILFIANSKNIKEAEIARAVNKGTGQITNWKNRNTTPPAELLLKIAKLLNVSIEYLITGKDTIELGALLPEQEQLLLNYYHSANQEGQERIIEQAEFLSAKYPKLEGKSSEYKIG